MIIIMTILKSFRIIIHYRSNFILESFFIVCLAPFQCFGLYFVAFLTSFQCFFFFFFEVYTSSAPIDNVSNTVIIISYGNVNVTSILIVKIQTDDQTRVSGVYGFRKTLLCMCK